MIRKSRHGSIAMLPVTATQPTNGGNAPAAPPMTRFCGVERLGPIHMGSAHSCTLLSNSAPSLTRDIDLCSVAVLTPHCRNVRPRRHHLINGSSLYWWNGGGDGSVHSSVVAPAPHGLSAALSLR